MGTPPPQILDLLKVDQATYDRVVGLIDTSAAFPTAAKKRRKNPRLRYTPKAPVVVVLNPERDGPIENVYLMRPVDLSQTGLGLLHGCFVYPGTRCCVLLPDLQGKVVQLVGTVVYSRHITDRIHNVGFRFDEPIETERFAESQTSLEEARGVNVWQNGWTDLVDASAHDIETLIRSIRREAEREDDAQGRKGDRFDLQEGAILAVMNPAQPDERQVYRVVPIDISSSGTGFVHGSFVYPGTPCDIMMMTMEGTTEQIGGIVSTCRHLQAKLHAIGVRFNQLIDVSRFVVIEEPIDEASNEPIEAEQTEAEQARTVPAEPEPAEPERAETEPAS